LRALGPFLLEPGDSIVVLSGGKFPFVLRRSQESFEKYRFPVSGECWVEGLMKGELNHIMKKRRFAISAIELYWTA
jgi:hypothetical protein